uniref:Cyclin dependent kinase inhibitor 2C n=1 Tax=Zonotrichia albicollis TaxID=44394 RepID=A0A8D2M458_ZONAL
VFIFGKCANKKSGITRKSVQAVKRTGGSAGANPHPRYPILLSLSQVMKLGNPEIARRLLSNGANPNLRDSTGFAVIHDVAREGFLDTLQTLLEFEADVNIEDNEGNLPLHLAGGIPSGSWMHTATGDLSSELLLLLLLLSFRNRL